MVRCLPMRLRFLFVLLSIWACALVNPGNLGTVDTARRLQVARWIRRGEPPVRADDPSAGPIGRNGVRYLPTGIGQSLVLVPFDAFASASVGPLAQRFGLHSERRAQMVELVVAFLMQTFLTACLLILAYEVLRSFEFAAEASAAGALALLFGTTVLAYVQAAQENLLLLVLALLMLWSIRRYCSEPSLGWAVLAGAASGLALLTRMTSAFEIVLIALFGLAGTKQKGRLAAGFLPPILCALIFDRWYQYYRFGSVFSTYIGVTQSQLRPPGSPENYYFSYPFWKGFLGALFSPDKSVLLFDPLLLVLAIVAIWRWRELKRDLRVALLLFALLALIYISASAKYVAFGGDVAWGDRYVLLPIQLLCLFAVPILIGSAKAMPQAARFALWSLVTAALLLQASSTVIAPNLEVEQRKHGFNNGVVWNRAINLEQIALDREQPARFAGIPIEWRTLYYFPFQLRFRFPTLARWAIAAWLALLVTLPLVILGTLWGTVAASRGEAH
jgi:Dolichyl-phosphate-mannose-protein mannosyltransferase